MKVQEDTVKGLHHSYVVTVPANDFGKKRDEKLLEYGKKLNIKGFRPGKAPITVIRQQYGSRVMGEVLEQIVGETSQKLFKDKKLTPAMQPKIEIKEFAEDKDLIYAIAFDIQPEFEVKGLEKLSVTKPVTPVDDKAVDEALTTISKDVKDFEEIEGKSKAKSGDVVKIDYKGRLEETGEEQAGMTAEGYTIELGSGSLIPGFEDQIIGQVPGASFDVNVTFPENYHAKDLAGKKAVFETKLVSFMTEKKAKIDDAFAEKMGFKTLEELKDAIRTKIEGENAQWSRMKVKKDLFDKLDKDYSFELPQMMVDQEFEHITNQIEKEKAQEGGKLDEAEKKELKPLAERRVRLGLILAKLGQDQKIQVSQQELQQGVIAEAQKFPGQEQQVFDYYSKNAQALESLKAPLYEDKVVDYILEQTKVTEKEVSLEELQAEDDEFPTQSGSKTKTKTKSKSPSKDAKETKAKAKESKSTKTKAKKD